MALDLTETALEQRDPPICETAVGLELRLAGAARSDTAAQALEVLPHPAHPRQVVLQLGQLDLELPLGRDGVLGEDVEDQLRSVDDARGQCVLERALLGRIELVVDDEHVCFELLEDLLELMELALADVRPRVGRDAVLDDVTARLDACGSRQLGQLGQLGGRVDSLREHGEKEPPFGLRARAGIRLTYRHDAQSCR